MSTRLSSPSLQIHIVYGIQSMVTVKTKITAIHHIGAVPKRTISKSLKRIRAYTPTSRLMSLT